MDDGLTAGWLVAALYRTLRRSFGASVSVTTHLLQPLRDAITTGLANPPIDPEATPWRVVNSMRVFGVEVSDRQPRRRHQRSAQSVGQT